MKVKAKDLDVGDVFFIGKKKCEVRTISIIAVPVTRHVDTAVITYTPYVDDDDNKDGEVVIDHHVAASKKLEVIPPSLFRKLAGLFTPTKKEVESKPEPTVKKPDVPFFVKKKD